MEIIRSWREIRIMLKRRFSVLSDADFEYEGSSKENMLDGLAARLQKTRPELASLLAECQKY